MQVPLETAFRHVQPTDIVRDEIRDQVDRLERIYDRITGCRVVIEGHVGPDRKLPRYRVRIHIAVPRRELVVDREPSHVNQSVLSAVRDSFRAARSQVKAFSDDLRNTARRSVSDDAPLSTEAT